MSLRDIRPHYNVTVATSGMAAMARLEQYLASPDADVVGWMHQGQAELSIPQQHRHWWSPRLAIHIQRETEGTATLHCRYQPDPGLWTLYMACWAIIAVLTMLAIGFGWAQSIMGTTPTALYGLPFTVLGVAGLYVWALVGQRFGEDEMDLLTAALNEALGELVNAVR